MAEILIVIGIIGLIAEMTIPTLLQNYQKQVYVTQLKKIYTVTNQALSQMAFDFGCPGDLACTGFFNSDNQAGAADEITKHMKVIKNYSTGAADCFSNKHYNYDGKGLDYAGLGIPNTFPEPLNENSQYYKYALADGTAIAINTIACTKRGELDVCGTLLVDLNGAKPPHREGRDIFSFVITKNALLYPVGGAKLGPSWASEEEGNDCVGPTAYTYGCAGRIMEEGWVMNY